QSAGVECTGRDSSEHLASLHRDRRAAVDLAAVTELSAEVVSPAPRGAVGAERAGVIDACCDLHIVASAADLYRQGPEGVGAITELAVLVLAPAPECLVGPDGAGVRRPRACHRELMSTADLHRCGL